ncbi:methanogenesis marker protein 11 [Methanothrix sp.]|uniref:methanogenesis marker protein 11 n=1 Tax=Methanothrix sp. TaxID=90426 RepID=UPI0032B01D52
MLRVVLDLDDPYVVAYRQIHAISSPSGEMVEILERSSCYGGSAWARYHYSKGPLVVSSRNLGEWFRYLVRTGEVDLDLISSRRSAGISSVFVKGDEVEITYTGLGGGGVGATFTRARAGDVIRSRTTEAGGGRVATGTIVVPRRERLVIGVDNTDSKTTGATWSLVHNIAEKVDRYEARYISHSLVQLFPVPTKTQNCVSTAVEFACIPGREREMVEDFRKLLERYTVSDETGMVVCRSFDPSMLLEYAKRCRLQRVSYEDALNAARSAGLEIVMDGQGLIGAVAAVPYFAESDRSVVPEWLCEER